MKLLPSRNDCRRLVVCATSLTGLPAFVAPAFAYAPMRRGPQTAADWAILLLVLVPVGVLAYRAENARAEKRRRQLLENGIAEDEIAFLENQRDLRLRLLALGLIIFATPLLYWMFFD